GGARQDRVRLEPGGDPFSTPASVISSNPRRVDVLLREPEPTGRADQARVEGIGQARVSGFRCGPPAQVEQPQAAALSLAFYMDAHVPRAVTLALRLRSIDVLTAQEDGAAQLDDDRLLQRATEL